TIQPLRMTDKYPLVGDTVEVCGFGGPRGELRHYRGRIVPSRLDTSMQLDCMVAAGDSGGPVLNTKGEVITVVSAGTTDEWNNGEARAHSDMVVPKWTPVRNFLDRVVAKLRQDVQ